MLIVKYRNHGIKLAHVWFATTQDIVDRSYKLQKADIYYLHGISADSIGGGYLLTKQNSLIKDLSLSEDEMFNTLGKSLRKHIKKSERDGLVKIEFYDSEEILKNTTLLSTGKHLYEKMKSDKGIGGSFNTALAIEYCKANALMCGLATIEANPVGFCAVIYHQENSRAWVGAFDFRGGEYDTHIMSNAHRELNWKRMLWLKEHGVREFDFGGIDSFEKPNGVSLFKMEFEQNNKITYNNFLVPGSLLGRAAVKYFLYRGRD